MTLNVKACPVPSIVSCKALRSTTHTHALSTYYIPVPDLHLTYLHSYTHTLSLSHTHTYLPTSITLSSTQHVETQWRGQRSRAVHQGGSIRTAQGQTRAAPQRPQPRPLQSRARLPSRRSDHPHERLLRSHVCSFIPPLLHRSSRRHGKRLGCLGSHASRTILRFFRRQSRAMEEEEQFDGRRVGLFGGFGTHITSSTILMLLNRTNVCYDDADLLRRCPSSLRILAWNPNSARSAPSHALCPRWARSSCTVQRDNRERAQRRHGKSKVL